MARASWNDGNTRTPFTWVDGALRELDVQGLLRKLAVRETSPAAVIEIDGRRLVNFGSNDYLGLAGEERLMDATATAHVWGVGAGASPLITGRTALHAELERRLAEFERTEAALLFPTGFAANAGTIPALADDGDVILADAKNHASLIDGCRLSRAERHVYPHADCEALEALLRQSEGKRRRLIVSDTLFSMDGDLAPLAEIVEAARRYDAMVLLDEAHATGVFGQHGRGILEHLGLEQETRGHVIRTATLSKAFGAAGGFVCGPQRVIDWLANRARTYVFSTAAPAPVAAAALAGLDVVQSEPRRRTELLRRAAALRDRLKRQGWNVGPSQSQIIPIIVGEAGATMALAESLRERGYFIPGIRPPTVPPGESLLRLSLCWHHTEEMIAGLVETLERAKKQR
jgi:8-amino-7-oxononanoate synthase